MGNFEKLIKDLEGASECCDVEDPELSEAVDKAIEILQRLDQWCDAYPEDIFPPIKDWGLFHEVLAKHGLSGTRFAADCMRYTVTGFKKVINDE